MPSLTWLKSARGLNTKVDPVRGRYDPETGVLDLAIAYNVDIDNTGRVSRRKGFTKRVTLTGAHSIWARGNMCLFVQGTSLYRLHSDWTYSSLATVTEGSPMSYCQVNNEVYYANGYETGKIDKHGIAATWEASATWVGANTTRNFSDPPVGTILEYYNGRMYVVQGNAAWFSEPMDFTRFDLVRNYVPVEHNILMFRAVEDGIYIGTETRVEFVKGSDPKEFRKMTVHDYPPIQHTDVPCQGRLAILQDGTPSIDQSVPDNAVMWLSERGVCFGGHGGAFYNLTDDKLAKFPAGITGSGMVHDGRYVGLIDP